jgi:hypothetical protein
MDESLVTTPTNTDEAFQYASHGGRLPPQVHALIFVCIINGNKRVAKRIHAERRFITFPF